ncbi:hypothetical protein T492DRAFT_840187 [Pavlovales sp. CCMP2436]|nr:hypothetical protein T492DRAFT_840187 [Pavlovales sp. CCMP2436]
MINPLTNGCSVLSACLGLFRLPGLAECGPNSRSACAVLRASGDGAGGRATEALAWQLVAWALLEVGWQDFVYAIQIKGFCVCNFKGAARGRLVGWVAGWFVNLSIVGGRLGGKEPNAVYISGSEV